ncbi:conjugative transposon protein TraN [Sphingobacterium sp.]|uniref:conjugative transposon protein TraN n=1 Tax=Sphingobacterium sp. TaxID=341027 RepID=UPI0028ABD731|nr:conjugative transposon protein TraN [Sphingobacterium sp.]
MDKLPKIILIWICLLDSFLGAKGQSAPEPQSIRVSKYMTTNLIFPIPILSVDLGNPGLIAQRASGVQNVLQVKAASRELRQTNLTVITQDGKLHSFLASYSELADPINLTVQEGAPGQSPVRSIKKGKRVPPPEVTHGMEWVRKTELTPFRLTKKSNGISFVLDGIFIQGSRMYLRFRLHNESHIPFHIDQLRFSLKDNRTAKRTAVQELEIIPEYMVEGPPTVIEHIRNTVVVSLPSFTIPRGRHLLVELRERSGGRDLELKVRNSHVLKTRPVPIIQ